MGRTASSCFHGLQPVSASSIAAQGQVTDFDGTKIAYEVPRALAKEDLPAVVEEYRVAAANARVAGMDGVEVHSANGYLLDQFLQTCSNTRTDEYGGSLENRFRLLREVLTAVKGEFPAGRVGVRLSPNGLYDSMGGADNLESFSYFLKELAKMELAYVHIMDGLGFGFHEKCAVFTLEHARTLYPGIIIGNCGYTRETAESAVGSGSADMIAFGRPYMGNPDLAERLINNLPFNEPALDHTMYWTYPGFPSQDPELLKVGYTDQPFYKA
jgi:N-ethylmaleimide reductase